MKPFTEMEENDKVVVRDIVAMLYPHEEGEYRRTDEHTQKLIDSVVDRRGGTWTIALLDEIRNR